MQNKLTNKTGYYFAQRVANNGVVYPNPGSFTYAAERVVCPTSQNTGDKIRGTNFYYTVTKQMPLVGSYSYKSNSYGTYTGSGQMFAIGPRRVLDAAALTNCSNTVIMNVLEKIRGNIDLSVDAFQLKQTVRMLMNPVRGFTTFVKAFRKRTLREYTRRKWKNRPSWSEFFSNKWLEAIYGWYPFVQTAYGIAGQAANVNKPGPSLQLFTASAGDDNVGTWEELQNFAGQSHYVSVVSADRIKMKAFALLKLSDSAKAKMASTYTSMNPASVKWETIPYSFVIDWFYGIGDYLRACESATIYGAFTDSFWISRTRIVNTQIIGLPWKGSGMTGSLSGSGTGQEISFERIRFSTIPLPSKPITKGVDSLHWTQLTSAMALLRQAFR